MQLLSPCVGSHPHLLPGAAQEHSQPPPGTGRKALLSSRLYGLKGLAKQAGDRGSDCQWWPHFLSFLSHGKPQSQTLSFLQLQQAEVTTFPGIFTEFLAQLLPAVWQNILTLLINP